MKTQFWSDGNLFVLRIFTVAILIAGLVMVTLPAIPVKASTTITVTTTQDEVKNDGYCSLREAIIAANTDKAPNSQPGECPAGSGTDTIIVPAGTYTITRTDNGKEDSGSTGDLNITSNMSIIGAGAGETIISGVNFTDHIFEVDGGTVTLSGMTIQGGNIQKGDGGGVENLANLTLSNVIITGNQASGNGGGVSNASTGTLTITGSTINGNTAAGNGGGVSNAGGALTILNSTINGNIAGTAGGGVYQNGGTTLLNNVTDAANVADINANGSGDGGGVFTAAGAFNVANTIIANNQDMSPTAASPDCAGTLTSQGYNLIQSTAGCTISGTTTGDVLGQDPQLGPLQLNGGTTPTQALGAYSPAVEAGNPATPGSGGSACLATDQRGITRPQGLTCDIGAYEQVNPLQAGPIFTVNNNGDANNGCTLASCSLREAITDVNHRTPGANPFKIVFAIPGGAPQTISPASPLPAITTPVAIDGSTQTGQPLGITLDGAKAGSPADGLAASGGGVTLTGLVITHFSGNGVTLSNKGGDLVKGNTLTANSGDGVAVLSGTGDTISANSISNSGKLGIDLGGDGVTPDHIGAATGPNNLQNYPVLASSVPVSSGLAVQGRISGLPGTAYLLEFFASSACNASGFGEGANFLGSASLTTGSDGNLYFDQTIPYAASQGSYITATATDPGGNTSEFSQCIIAGPDNTSWPKALEIPATGVSFSVSNQSLDKQGQVRWYKFKIQPNSRIIVTLTHLPANYDLTLYKDISQAYNSASTPADLARLGAEFSADQFSADQFSADAFSADQFSADAFSADQFSADQFSADQFSADQFSPDAYQADQFSADSFSADQFSADQFSPDQFSADQFSAAAFQSAQTRSLIGVSAFDGTASEGLAANTWSNTGYFYARVRGRNGIFDLGAPFTLTVTQISSACSTISDSGLPATSLTAAAGSYQTLILTDSTRLTGSSTDLAAMNAALNAFAARPEVAGKIVDVSQDARVAAANTQADANPSCPSAKNIVAASIQNIVSLYAQANPHLQYLVIVGADNVIPFFRHPDQSLLASEQNYVPPVKDSSPSQAALKLNYVLSQDDYGAVVNLSSRNTSFPVPGLATGRLVENPSDITTVLNAYLATSNGVVSPQSSLVTGYDFMASTAQAVQANLQAGTGKTGDALITPAGVPPTDPSSWTASQLSQMLLGSRHDIVFLAGHFSAGSALAADYTTRLLASDVASSTVDLTNSIIFSAGCHSGYNVVNADGIPQVTPNPDWAQAFAHKGATLIAGTGYQYGDTDFIKYSDKLYLNFSQQLLDGSGPVSIGKALVAAKQQYIANTPDMHGIDQKAVLEATLFGLPMLSVNMPSGRITPPADSSIVSATTGFTTNPGQTLGLTYADVSVTPKLTQHNVTMTDISSGSNLTATYYSGTNGTVSRPDEPVLPLENRNVTVPGTVLRGVGFRGGSYTDLTNVLPLTGAISTELHPPHTPFYSSTFYPVSLWQINYFDALSNPASGQTRLLVKPAQFQSVINGSPAGTLRVFNGMNFRLFYSDNTTTYGGGSVPALSDAPSINTISSTIANGAVTFHIHVVGNPAAGIQQVWVTYTSLSGAFTGAWQSLDLTQNPNDSTLWEGTLNLNGTSSSDVRYIVQAANGVGLVSFSANVGAYYTPGYENTSPTTPTSLTLGINGTSAPYGTSASMQAVLTSNGAPLPNQMVSFRIGGLSRSAVTDSTGKAAVSVPLLAAPGSYSAQAVFAGTPVYVSSTAGGSFTITKQNTQLALNPSAATSQYGDPTQITAVLTDATGKALPSQTIFFIVTGNNTSLAFPVITDYAGRAPLGAQLSLTPGTYTVSVYYNGTIPLSSGSITLDDYRYNPSTASGTLSVTPKALTMTYTGDTADPVGTTANLSVQLSPANGTPTSYSGAQVQFTVLLGATQVFQQAVPVSSSGAASVQVPNLATGIYHVQAALVSSNYTASPLNLMLAIYDPTSTGSITGSAGINSPAGAYPANPSLTGSTSFGLNAGYNSGQPNGQSQFQFQAASFNFHSSSYAWVVTTGARGEYMGTGTVNGAGSYGFIISVIDGSQLTPTQTDTFRIKVWDPASGTVLYDSQMGDPDYADPTTPITGGSLTVH